MLIWTDDQVPSSETNEPETDVKPDPDAKPADTDAKPADTNPDDMENVDTESDQVNRDDAKSDDPKPSAEPPVKWSTPKITDDMSPNTKQSIMDKRLERKQEMSRKWHQKFDKAGVTRKQLNIFNNQTC